MYSLHELGWSPFFQQHHENSLVHRPARVVEEQRSAYRVLCEAGELTAELSGRFRHSCAHNAGLPAVGDWVLIEPHPGGRRAVIHGLLPRRTRFSRKQAGEETAEQIIAANIDTVFFMTSLNGDLNPRRVERYLTTIWDSGAQPVVLLSKADLCTDVADAVRMTAEAACGIPIHVISAIDGGGLEHIYPYLKTGQTVALLGSSGVGKSTLINWLLGGAVQRVRDIRADDDRGRHTTTARRLFVLPGGGMLIDTPGMRELQLWNAGDGLSQTFDDIAGLSQECRFRDCLHDAEPGCAVRQALSENRLAAGRLESYLKLQRELGYLARKQDVLSRIQETKKWKQIHKAMKERNKRKDRA